MHGPRLLTPFTTPEAMASGLGAVSRLRTRESYAP